MLFEKRKCFFSYSGSFNINPPSYIIKLYYHEDDERTRVGQKQKNVLGRSEAVPIKLYGSLQHKKRLLKKGQRNDRIRSPGVRAFHNNYFALRNWIEADDLTVNETMDGCRPSGVDITSRRPARRISLSSGPPPEIPLPAPEFHEWRELVGSRTRQRLEEEIFISERIQARGGGRNLIKHGDPERNKDLSLTSQKWLIVNKRLEFHISKVTACKPNACNVVSNFNMLVNCLVQSFLVSQNLKSLFPDVAIKFDLFWSGDPISNQHKILIQKQQIVKTGGKDEFITSEKRFER